MRRVKRQRICPAETEKAALEDIDANITAHHKDHIKHQGFRGTFGLKAADGGPQRLEDIEATVLAKRKAYIDKGAAVGPAIDKLRVEYVARVAAALRLAEKYKAAGDRTISTALTDLEALDKTISAWLDDKSDKYGDIDQEIKRMESDFDQLDKLTKPTLQKDFNSGRPKYTLLASRIALAKTKLNTDHKMLKILQTTLGTSMPDKKVLDQTPVKTVLKHFVDAKAKFKTMEADLVKVYEARVVKIEKKVVK